jgi:hypothetical protein
MKQMIGSELETIKFDNEMDKELFIHVMRKLAVRIDLFTQNGLAVSQGRYFDEGLQSAVFEVQPVGMNSPVMLFMTVDRQVFITADNVFAAKQFMKTGFGIGIIRAVTRHISLDLAIVDADSGDPVAEIAAGQ